jgi:hypothetical protein
VSNSSTLLFLKGRPSNKQNHQQQHSECVMMMILFMCHGDDDSVYMPSGDKRVELFDICSTVFVSAGQ